ncbi:MAG: MYG1 family protein, partial [Bacteroidota bacterium]
MKTIGTHNGSFHPDDVFAVACIQLLEGKENVKIVRTREQETLDTCDWVVDVGREYDSERKRFDHHQPGASERENGIQYAAFGLIWKHYGEQLAGSAELADKIAEKLVLPIDAHDVGITLYETNELEIHPTQLFDVIYSFKPPWQSGGDMDTQFLHAVDFARTYLERVIEQGTAKLAMKAFAVELYESAADKEVIVSDRYVSTSQFIDFPEVAAVVTPDDNGSGNW